MGLDSYLTAEKYMSDYEESERVISEKIRDSFDTKCPGRVKSVVFEVMYWRKSNHIHDYFVKNVQGGVDDCGKYPVDLDVLQELLDIIHTVIDNHSKASELLPTVGGFFFGNTNYDEDYFYDLEDTEKELTKLLNTPDIGTWDFYYRASW